MFSDFSQNINPCSVIFFLVCCPQTLRNGLKQYTKNDSVHGYMHQTKGIKIDR